MVISAETLRQFTIALLRALETPEKTAARVAASVINADRRGSGTHGLTLLPLYARMIHDGAIDVKAEPVTEPVAPCLAKVDGRNDFGQLTGEAAVRAGIELAGAQGIAAVGIRSGGHLGRLGEWAEIACGEELVFMAFSNTGGGARNVAAASGHGRVLSTNPVAFGVPAYGALPFDIVIDFATSQVSGSAIREYFNAGRRLDPEWTVPTGGGVTDDPALFMEAASVLLPLGGRSAGHKGFGLAIFAELLGGIAGGLMAGEREDNWFSNAAMFVFVDPLKFISRDNWRKRIGDFAAYLESVGARLPGAGAHAREQQARPGGIDIPEHVAAALAALAVNLEVAPPGELAAASAGRPPPGIKTW